MLTSGLAARKGLTEREHRLLVMLGFCTLMLALTLQWSLYAAATVERPERCGSLHMSCDAVRQLMGD